MLRRRAEFSKLRLIFGASHNLCRIEFTGELLPLSALPPKADIARTCWQVRFVPNPELVHGNMIALLKGRCVLLAPSRLL
jgi:hypothetical protein